MNRPLDSLEDLILSLQEEGGLNSSGIISLDPSRSLEKAAEFQLPFAGAWALKVIQAAVFDGASEIQVRLTRNESIWEWPQSSWNASDFEQAYCDYRQGRDQGLNDLVQGLWQLGLHQRRPFQLEFPDAAQKIVWDGQRLLRIQAPLGANLRLRVSHRALGAKSVLERLPFVETARRNVELQKALDEYAFCCPVPLHLDGFRLDGFQRGPSNAWGRGSSHLYHCCRLAAPVPELPMGSGIFEKYGLGPKQSKRLAYPQWWEMGLDNLRLHPKASVLVILGSTECYNKPATCRLLWVKSGVIVGQESYDLPCGRLRFFAFASADGLRVDLSTLGIAKDDPFFTRLGQIEQALGQWLSDLPQDSLADQLCQEKRAQLCTGLKALCAWGALPSVLLTAGEGLAGGVMVLLGSMGVGFLGVMDYRRGPQAARAVVDEMGYLRDRWLARPLDKTPKPAC